MINKNLTEHQYVVDMIQDAMEETCSEVMIPEQPRLFKLKNIQHLYTPVSRKSKSRNFTSHFSEKITSNTCLRWPSKERGN